MSILPFVIGPAISAVGSIIGGNRAAGAARESANLQNEAAQRQLEYEERSAYC